MKLTVYRFLDLVGGSLWPNLGKVSLWEGQNSKSEMLNSDCRFEFYSKKYELKVHLFFLYFDQKYSKNSSKV